MAQVHQLARLTAAIAAAALMALAPSQGLAQIAMKSPKWAELSPQERQVLAPLQSDWDRLEPQRKLKWRGIAQRYPNMGVEEQQRIQQQMKSWAELTPAQRQAAREQYKNLRQLPPEKKDEVRQKWQEYQNLPPDQKRELASRAPPPAAQGQAGRTMSPPMTPPPGVSDTKRAPR